MDGFLKFLDEILVNYCISFLVVLAGYLIAGRNDTEFRSLVLAAIFLTIALTILRR